jgi:putative FmdB family regulatory protein
MFCLFCTVVRCDCAVFLQFFTLSRFYAFKFSSFQVFALSNRIVSMPIYAYRCSSCHHAQDILRKISDAPLVTCTACGLETFTKQVTAAGFALKGSGWYVTDFRGEGSGSKSSDGTATAPKTTTTATATETAASTHATSPSNTSNATSAAPPPSNTATAAASTPANTTSKTTTSTP